MKNKTVSNKSQEINWMVGFIIRRHTYIERFLEQVIIKYMVDNEEKRRKTFEEFFIKEKTFGFKLAIFNKLNKRRIFGKPFDELYNKLKRLNHIRNAVAHIIVKFPLNEHKSPDLSKPSIPYKGKKFYLDIDLLKEVQTITKEAKQELEKLINGRIKR